MTMDEPTVQSPPVVDAERGAPNRVIPVVIVLGVVAVLSLGWLLIRRAESRVNQVAMSSSAKPVTVVAAKSATFRDSRLYVGTLRPWVQADVGPQFVSAYVDTVLVRPGAKPKRNEVLATLDCRNASAASQAVAAEARAIDARQRAVAHESARINTLLDGGFVSPNEAEQTEAQSAAEEAQLASQRAKLTSTALEVSDCILRSPFDGEVATRTVDPGAFVRPGMPIVSVVDRTTVRTVFDVPESDFDLVAPGAPISVHVVATDRTLGATISRRSPSADPDTRTVHCEADMPNSDRSIPVNTTGEVRIEVGPPIQAVAVPLDAAAITGSKAALFVVTGAAAHKTTFKVLGERGGTLYIDRSMQPGTQVVTEGRAILADGDAVAAKEATFVPDSAAGTVEEAQQ